jgi:ferritin-like metal-binding protein YciE
MAIASLQDLYFDELSDLYDAETQMLRTLPRLAEAARAPELRETLQKHSDESRLHLERLELIFTHWGERRRPRPSVGLAGIVQEADNRLNRETTADARDAAIIGVAQRFEHYEIAAYGCARTYARRLNRIDEARLLQETLDEEGRADRRLTELAEAHINDDARTEWDMQSLPSVGRLKFVPLDQVSRAGHRDVLAIRNEADEPLGDLDGLVVDGDSGDARYIVVHTGGILGRRRYLLPVTMVRSDEDARVLRVDLDERIAARYPAFDRDEFHTMTAADQRRYELDLLECFPRRQMASGRQGEGATPPEWLMTGAWVTVSPQTAERLSPEARSFANEFVPDREQMVASEKREPASARLDAKEPANQPIHLEPQTTTERSTTEMSTPPQGDKIR